jgi:HAMP domain-containing protein
MSMLSDYFSNPMTGGLDLMGVDTGSMFGGGGVNYDFGKYNKMLSKALNKRGLGGMDSLMGSARNQMSSWMDYDPTLNPVTGTGSITGSGMGAILDALARNSYQNVETAVNKQANVGREAAIDELSRRGIVTSSEAPASMSVLESQRLDQINNAAQNIEAQRLQGQMQIPGMLQGIGNFGAQGQQQLINNIFQRFGLAGQLAGGGMQAQAMNNQAGAQGLNSLFQLGQATGSYLPMML